MKLVFRKKSVKIKQGKDWTVFLVFWADYKELSVLRLKNVSLLKILEVYHSI